MNYRQVPIDVTPDKRVNKARFNLSHEVKQDIKLGLYTPVLCLPTLPGDEWEMDTEFLFNFDPLYYPINHIIDMTADWYFVPNRIVWPSTRMDLGNDGWATTPGWEEFITGQDAIGGGPIEHPYVDVDNAVLSVVITGGSPPYTYDWDFLTDDKLGVCLGLPGTIRDNSAPGDQRMNHIIERVNALPFAGYWAIWNYWLRNEHIEPELEVRLGPGDNTTLFTLQTSWPAAPSQAGRNLFQLAFAHWGRDYFTDATPTPQLGEAILIPSDIQFAKNLDGSNPFFTENIKVDAADAGRLVGATTDSHLMLPSTSTIRELRMAEALQSYYERVVRIGQKYRDFIKGMFGNDPQPGLVDVPVMIGRKSGKVTITEQTATSDTIYSQGEVGRRVGDYVGRAFLYKQPEDRFRYYCAEHGYIFCILTLKPNTTYGQGMPRWFRYELPEDYPLDMFSHVGDQEILQEELFYWGGLSDQESNQNTFGYIPRHSEMKYISNRVVGRMNYLNNLSKHYGRFWDNEIYINGASALNGDSLMLNQRFIQMAPEINGNAAGKVGGLRTPDIFRTLVDPGTQSGLYLSEVSAHMLHSLYVNRNLPYYSTPDLT